MVTHNTSTEQTCGRTEQNGKNYAQQYKQEKQHLGKAEEKSHIGAY